MDVNLRKTATDTAYVMVGVGVLGFQQAQVKRRDAAARVHALRTDARTSLSGQTDAIRTRAAGCAANLSDLGTTVGGTVSNLGSTVSGTVGGTVGDLGTSVSNTVGAGLSNTVGATLEAVSKQVKAGASAAKIADPRVWAEPVVGDVRDRVEPVLEQLRTISIPETVTATVSAIPGQLSKTIEVGKAKVQGRRGTTPTAVPKSVNGEA
jgi:hypothetical protein